MGLIKSMVFDQEYWAPDKFVCPKCTADQDLFDLAFDNISEDKTCDYCDDKRPGATHMAIIVERIFKVISQYYGDANETGVPWDGGYVIEPRGAHDIIGEFDPGWSIKLFEDIANSISTDIGWVEQSGGWWLGQSDSEKFCGLWKRFKNTTMYRQRYFFDESKEDEFTMAGDDFLLSSFFEILGSLTRREQLVHELPAGTMCYRIRTHESEAFKGFSSISVPPEGCAGAGRMNPLGIPYLYTSLDSKTPIVEVITRPGIRYGLAEMETQRGLQVLDLSVLPPMPGIFNLDSYDLRQALIFLREFSQDIAKQVDKSKEGEHLEYIPTQIVSEYFRYVFQPDKANPDERLDGLIFNSAQNPKGKNLVLFTATHEEVEQLLELKSIEIYRSTG